MVIILTNIKGLGLLCFIKFLTKIGPVVPGKRIFKVFLPYMGMAAILVM